LEERDQIVGGWIWIWGWRRDGVEFEEIVKLIDVVWEIWQGGGGFKARWGTIVRDDGGIG
jgi:hypothetical protein